MRVSVVMMAVAKDFSASSSSPRPATTAGMAAISFSTGSGTPMIPVDDGMMNCGAASSAAPSAAQLCSATANPGAPVAQLALPALTSTARTRPLFLRRCARPTSTGAATTRLRVNMAAALAPSGASASATSLRPLALMPALVADQRNPRGRNTGSSGPCRFISRVSPAAAPGAVATSQDEEESQIAATRRDTSPPHRTRAAWDSSHNPYKFCPAALHAWLLQIPCAQKNPECA